MTLNKTNYQFSWQCLDFLKRKSRGFIHCSHAFWNCAHNKLANSPVQIFA